MPAHRLGAILILGLLLSGCDRTDPPASFSLATTGQQLTDLRIAYDRGVITEAEYYRKRAQLLR